MGAPEGQEGDVHLPPVVLPLVLQLVEGFGHVVVAVVCYQVVLRFLESRVGPVDGLVPLLVRKLVMVQLQILQRRSEGQLVAVHRAITHEVKYRPVRLANPYSITIHLPVWPMHGTQQVRHGRAVHTKQNGYLSCAGLIFIPIRNSEDYYSCISVRFRFLSLFYNTESGFKQRKISKSEYKT